MATIDAPSILGRAILALALLIGFYVVTLGVALVLLLIPVALMWTADWTKNARAIFFTVVLCWIPAGLLFASVFAVRRTPFVPRGRRLAEADAPELFEILRELADKASTRAPSELYLTNGVDLSVTEDVGIFGKGGRRVLSIGAPVLEWITVDELRAGLAHELGHFAFGDTRLLRLVSYAHAAFRAVIESTGRARSPSSGFGVFEAGFAVAKTIGDALVANYAKIFFRLTCRSDRRAELAADQLAARLVGAAPAIRLLEKFAVEGPLYEAYLCQEVTSVVSLGGLPLDLTAGFAAFSARVKERGITQAIEAAARRETTDPFDSHPALGERVEALGRASSPPEANDSRGAAALVKLDLNALIVESLRADIAKASPEHTVTPMAWADIPRTLVAPHQLSKARAVAARLSPIYPDARTLPSMFAAIIASLAAGQIAKLAHDVEPGLASAPPHLYWTAVKEVGSQAAYELFCGALLERGAELDIGLGETGFVFRIQGTSVIPGELASRALADTDACAALQQWAASLANTTACAPPTVSANDASRALLG